MGNFCMYTLWNLDLNKARRTRWSRETAIFTQAHWTETLDPKRGFVRHESLWSTQGQRENFSEILQILFSNIIFYFLKLFQSFLKAYLCHLIQVDLFGGKFWETESHPPNFRTADSSPKILAGLILQFKRYICPSKSNRNLSVPWLRRSEVMFRQRTFNRFLKL